MVYKYIIQTVFVVIACAKQGYKYRKFSLPPYKSTPTSSPIWVG